MGDRRANLLRVLTYHRVDTPEARPHLDSGLISASPTEFAEQMEHLAEHRRVVTLEEVLCAFRGEHRLPPGSVLITFDDAYEDFDRHAWPTLRRLRLSATMFVPTALPGDSDRCFWVDRLYRAIQNTGADAMIDTHLGPLCAGSDTARTRSLRRLIAHVKSLPHQQALETVDRLCDELAAPLAPNGVMDWDTLRRLAGEGVCLAPHTRTHPLLSRLPLEEARNEVLGSLDDLRRRLGPTPAVLAYPSGAFDEAVAQMLEEEGFEVAFTTCRGMNDLDRTDSLRVRRINVGRRTSSTVLRAQLLPWSRYCNRWVPITGAP